jgi:HKD family nuclease
MSCNIHSTVARSFVKTSTRRKISATSQIINNSVMTKITTRLSDNLKTAFETADEIWIAVALLNLQGFDFISKTIKSNCKINFIGGIDLPTDPAALENVLSLKTKYKHTVSAYILTKEIFHPKVYIISSKNRLKSFVGSANCTNGGLDNNIEMTVEIDDQETSKQLLEWFLKIQNKSQILTTDFIADYVPKYKNRLKLRKEEQAEIKDLKEREQKKLEANLKAKNLLISKLKRIRSSKDYSTFKQIRKGKIEELKKTLDYPNFINLDLSEFWKIKDLGTIVPIKVKAKIDNDRQKFAKLMKYICDESIPINERIDQALNGKLSIENVSKGFISKVLVIHNPNEYYIHNKEFEENLKPFGLSFPRGLTFGNKYTLTRDTLKSILVETEIDDFAVLDRCLIET